MPKFETREFVKTLDCVLTQPEILKYSRELANLCQSIDTAESRKKSVVKELDAGIAGLESQRSSIVEKITRGSELRDVKVRATKDYEHRVYSEERLDTFETINSRPLRDDERQPVLPGAQGGAS